jgi:anthranilate synthase component 1
MFKMSSIFKSIPTELSNDPLAVFESLEQENEYCFLLETLADKYQPKTSGQSYIGIAPVHHYAAQDSVFYEDGKVISVNNPYQELRRKVTFNHGLPSGYVGGLIGYFGHEAIQYLEPSLKFAYDRSFYDFQYAEYKDGLIFERERAPRYFYYDEDRLNAYKSIVGDPQDLRISRVAKLKDNAKYSKMIETALEDIKSGRVFQVVLANRFEYEFEGSLLHLYRQLRSINPSPFMFYVKFGNIITIGASPEFVVHTNTENQIFLEALAGTIRRGKTESEDTELASKLLADEKEIAEHSMLVDLARNDVGRVSKIGSVKVEHLMKIKKFSHVQHISSVVSGHLETSKDAFDGLASSFSAGTVSGAPKIEAVKMINELENAERGPYGGTIGYFSYNGHSVHSLNIRSLNAVDNKLFVHSGSGVVFDSTVEREAKEIADKKAAMDKAMSPFLQGAET